VKPEHVRAALKRQEEKGGQIGRILVRMGACSERAVSRALLVQVQLAEAAGAPTNLGVLARRNPAIAGLEVACSPRATSLILFLTDLVVLTIIGALATGIDFVIAGHLSPSLFHYGFLSLAMCAVVLGSVGWYAPIAQSPPDEIRTSTLSITLVFVSMALIPTFRWEMVPWPIIGILFFEWALACLALPIVRAVARAKIARQPWWGVPVVVLGAGKTGRKVVASLRARPQLGLRPVLVLDDDERKHGTLRASIGADEEVQVETCRNIPVPSMSGPDVGSGSIRSIDSATRSSAPRQRQITPAILEPAPHTIRSPTPVPPPTTLESAGVGGMPAALPASSSRHVVLPRDRPSSNRAAELFQPAGESPISPRPISSKPAMSMEPSFLHQVPDSIRGLVRGQFATIDGVPIVGDLALAPLLAERLKISYAILAMPGQSSRKLLQITERVGGAFPHLLVIPDLIGFASSGVPAREIAGVVGVEVRQQLLLSGPRFAKRMMDLALAGLGGIFILPIIAFLAFLIRLDSKGPALYTQKRLGQGGKLFTAFKFRTMHGDGEERLKALLEADSKLRAEYAEFHKLTRDPRITRIGRILRKYSLDELPQLLNVLRGDMSLVGPRPYLQREVPEMEHHERIILRSMPGMTGLWQVSDRNATGFAERLKMDVHYVRNWSPWLDLYILARTFGVVIGGTGS
jgi:exopolysaccharide biosynthesis polyprenyl glycosylphosphotransferase